ncbi:oligomeric complex COG6 [Mycena floridula]|nr:oligomeric complex COG6 [Mycena floridula]
MASPAASFAGGRKTSWSGQSSQSKNPISLRLYKVLGTNFDDDATREALKTLSALYAPVSSKGKEVVVIDDEDVEDDSAKRTIVSEPLETIPGESAARARKNLRRDMEEKLAEGSRHFLNAFGEVDQKLDDLSNHVAQMRADCDEAEKQLQLTSEASKTLLERAGNLREERQNVETKKSIVSLFLARFTLTEEEVSTITSRDVPLGPAFFQAMDKTEQIRTDCRVLMSGEEGPTKAGLDIMAVTSTHLEQGYEKMARWCSYEFRHLGRDAQLEVSPTMAETVRRLRKRPEMLTDALRFLSEIRQASLSSSFLAALTRGGPSGFPRPIELHAHDPMRYIGDMLAWVHQAIAAEREFLESLFTMKNDRRMVGSVRIFSAPDETEEWIRELMDLAVEKLCVPLKVRVQQTVHSQESSIVSYKIANLLQFYMITMHRTIGPDALLSKTLKEITDLAYKAFYDSIESQRTNLQRMTLDLDDPSLTPPIPILDHAQVLREIMSVYQMSFLGDEDADQQISGFQRVLDIMVDPAVQMCTEMAEDKQPLRLRWDMPVFVLNCLSYILSVLEPFSFTLEKQKVVQKIMDERLAILTDEHYQTIMTDAGLDQIAALCEIPKRGEPLSHVPSAQPHELQASLRQFSSWLSGQDVVESARLSRLTAQKLHIQVHHAGLARMARAYGKICDAVRKPENKYEAASTLLGSERPFGQVNLLWQIFGVEAVED